MRNSYSSETAEEQSHPDDHEENEYARFEDLLGGELAESTQRAFSTENLSRRTADSITHTEKSVRASASSPEEFSVATTV